MSWPNAAVHRLGAKVARRNFGHAVRFDVATNMKIALVSTCALSTPPAAYGGTELVVAELARGLTELDHEVVVYATGDSRPAGELKSCFERPVWPPDELAEERHAAFAFQDIRASDFDVVHMNHAAAIPFASTISAPCVATLHHDRVERLVQHYAAFPEVSFVAISQRQAELSPEVSFARVIHHGLDTDLYPSGDGGGGYLAFLGRFAASKGTHVALDVAHGCGMEIRLGGAAHEVDDAQAYFAKEVKPRLARAGEKAIWHGEVSHEPKLELLRGARALLFPIDWEEPFGLVMIEAMLVGTPVIAFGRGSVSEVVEDGVTGFVVHSAEEMAQRAAALDGFDRAACRARARERWSRRRMAQDYAELFEELAVRSSGRRIMSVSSFGDMDGSAALSAR